MFHFSGFLILNALSIKQINMTADVLQMMALWIYSAFTKRCGDLHAASLVLTSFKNSSLMT